MRGSTVHLLQVTAGSSHLIICPEESLILYLYWLKAELLTKSIDFVPQISIELLLLLLVSNKEKCTYPAFDSLLYKRVLATLRNIFNVYIAYASTYTVEFIYIYI